MRLYLVRHGESEGNAKHLFFGWTDYPLTALGLQQAQEAANALKEVSFTRCISSDLVRAWDTAVICTQGTGVAPESDPRLREQDMGDFENVTFQTAADLQGDYLMRMCADWIHLPPPRGESVQHMIQRVADCMDDVVRQGQDTLIVAHNGSLSLILRHFGLAREEELMNHDYNWFFRHGTYSEINITPQGAELVHFNR